MFQQFRQLLNPNQFKSLFGKEEKRVLIVGLDAAGN